MTQHHIIGTEAGARRPLAYLRELPRGRARGRGHARPFWLYLAAPPLGLVCLSIDQAVGFPICVLGILIAGGVYLFRPEGK